jgi:hypothetical protein
VNDVYTVTIREHRDEVSPDDQVQTVLRIDLTPPQPRIVEISVQSCTDIPLDPASLPRPDLAGIAAALTAADAPVGQSATTVDSTTAKSTLKDASDRSRDAGDATVSTKRLDGAHQAPGRAYRKMPPVDELMSAFEDSGTVSGLARHYGVPRHTAQGWMTRIRRKPSAKTGTTPSTDGLAAQ